MRWFIRFLPSFSILLLVFCVYNAQCAAARRARDAPRPVSINCQMGRWSSWSPCTSCTEESFRARRLEKPSQFGGSECIQTRWENRRCPDTEEPCMVEDYCGDKFTCLSSGRCISQSLRCNNVKDCDDFSDEDGCVETHSRDDYCSSLLPIPGAKNGIQGYNVLTGQFVDPVLDPKYYGETCEYVYNGEWNKFTYDAFCEKLTYNAAEKNFRKPYNYHTYQFVAEAASEGTHEYYEDAASLLKARKTEFSANFERTFGVMYVEVGVNASVEVQTIRNISEFKSKDFGFVRLLSKIQTAQFKMRSSELMLHEDMLMDLMDLPEAYDYGMYSRFIHTYGTHFVTEGTMGGTLENVVVINKTKTEGSFLQSHRIGACLGVSIGIAAPLKGAGEIGLKVAPQHCETTGGGTRDTTRHRVDIKDIFSLVKGGVTVTASGVMVIKDPETYRKWGASLKYHPIIIDHEVMPIFELVRRSTSADHVGARLANLERGFDEYLQEFDPCRCAPCLHNGLPVLSLTSCSCVCRSGYEGEACERTNRPDRRSDGAWSCWGPWSACGNGRKSRSRSCSNPSPSGGGATCLGSSSQSRLCKSVE